MADKRKCNFNAMEIEVLLAGIHERRDVLFGHLSSTVSHQQKNAKWEEITKLVNSAAIISGNSTGIEIRTADRLRTKWANVKCAAVKELSDNRPTKVHRKEVN